MPACSRLDGLSHGFARMSCVSDIVIVSQPARNFLPKYLVDAAVVFESSLSRSVTTNDVALASGTRCDKIVLAR